MEEYYKNLVHCIFTSCSFHSIKLEDDDDEDKKQIKLANITE